MTSKNICRPINHLFVDYILSLKDIFITI